MDINISGKFNDGNKNQKIENDLNPEIFGIIAKMCASYQGLQKSFNELQKNHQESQKNHQELFSRITLLEQQLHEIKKKKHNKKY